MARQFTLVDSQEYELHQLYPQRFDGLGKKKNYEEVFSLKHASDNANKQVVNSQDAPQATEENRNEAKMNAKREYCEKSFTTIVGKDGRRAFSPKMY